MKYIQKKNRLVGGGIQAIWHLRFLRGVLPNCRTVVLRTRSKASADAFVAKMKNSPYAPDREWTIFPEDGAENALRQCGLIHTVTPARAPVLFEEDVDVGAGVHITAIGSDSPGKKELADEVVARAEMLVCDSKKQVKYL